jgi:hypothetical protein
MVDVSVADFPAGTHGQITGLAAKPELNDEYCVSKGVNKDNPERLFVVTRTGAQISIRPSNLKPAELLPGSRVTMVGLANAAQYNGKVGEVLSWQGERWIVDLESKERKSFRSENLVLLPAKVAKRKAEAAPEPEAKKLKSSDLKDIESNDESKIAKAIQRAIREFPEVAQKCICCLATKQNITVMKELADHLTDKQNDGLLRRHLRPNEKVKGVEEMDALEQCAAISERKSRSLAAMCRINYCDLLGFFKQGLKEPKFNRPGQNGGPPRP